MAGLFVKKGDTVQVIASKDRGTTGKVISVDVARSRVLVEGVNRVTRHTKAAPTGRGATQGGIVTQEAAVHVSNVQVVCPSCHKATRVGRRIGEPGADGKARSTRYCKRCNGDI